jgi:hypothetical protein
MFSDSLHELGAEPLTAPKGRRALHRPSPALPWHRSRYRVWYAFSIVSSTTEGSPTLPYEKARENRLRRMAQRQGLEILKSRRRDPNALGFGRWMIVDPYNSNAIVADSVGPTGEPNLDLDDVELYLTKGPEEFYREEN